GIAIAHGLAAAHERRIIHRDLKPENVVVTRDGRVKILDFGLATVAPGEADFEHGHREDTLSGAILGTAGYMSPEQARGLSASPPSDIFSLGAMLYEMVSGRRAFRGGSAVETMHAILSEEPAPLADAVILPPSLEQIIRRCLQKNPEERFQSARDV